MNKIHNTPQAVLNELKEMRNRQEIEEMVDMEFSNDEKSMFRTSIALFCGAIVIVPSILLYI